MSERFEKMLQALDCERRHEEAYFRELSYSKSYKERIAGGILWYPVQVDKMHYSLAEKVELEVSPLKLSSSAERNSFKEGASAVFFTGGEERKEYRGSISFATRKRVRIILNDDSLMRDSSFQQEQCGIELIYDDRSYRVMIDTIGQVKNSADPAILELKSGISTRSFVQRELPLNQSIANRKNLNLSQVAAVNGALSAERLAIIHGPPGTGKTTTLVSLVETLSQTEKKILVAAPSNNAVDLLARHISIQGIPVLRIGNVSRIGDNISHLCLDEKVRNHKDWQHIKQVKIEAETAKKEAGKFKRKFGPQQKKDRYAFIREARELYKWAKELEYRLVDQIMEDTVVICATLIGCAHSTIKGWNFDTVLIDEGSQALEAESWVAMLKGKRTIIAGDHLQLPPTVKSDEAIKLGLPETILDRMTDHLKASFLLDTQYRMNDEILAFSNEHFYEGRLNSADFVSQRKIKDDHEIITFIDTSGCGFEEERSSNHRSLSNEGEYHMIREHILSIPHLISSEISVGIISPYARQVSQIRENISDDEVLRSLDIMVNSIDGFQGQEKDVIYISLVRSNEDGNIGFLRDYRRLNVALTRARYKLVVVGDMSTLGNDAMYLNLAEHFERHGTYKSAWEYMYQGQ